MTELKITALSTADAAHYRAGGNDANGQAPERQISDGINNPCRYCLRSIAAGETMLVLAHRPFPEPQPYAELGPIFLHADTCERHPETADLPDLYRDRQSLLVRGYGRDNRIKYGTGSVVPTDALLSHCRHLLTDPEVAYLHARSASNNCFQFRIDRRE